MIKVWATSSVALRDFRIRYDDPINGGRMRFLVILLFCLTMVLAQQPQLTVNSYTLEQGESLLLRASNLEPSSSYTLTLIAPGGESSARTLRSDSRGEVRYEGTLDLAGDWTIALRGDDINAMLGVAVTEAPAANSPVESEQNPLTQEPANPAQAEETTQPQAQQEQSDENQQVQEEPASQPETAEVTETQPTQTEQATTESQQATEETTSQTNQAEETIQSEETTQPVTPQQEATNNQTETAQEEVQPNTTEDLTPAPASTVNVRLEQGILTAIEDDQTKWTLDFPSGSGETNGLAEFGEVLYLGHGNSVLKINRDTGNIEQRFIVSGQVTELGGGPGMLTVESQVDDGLTETLTIQNDQLQETVRFGNQPELFNWLSAEADVDNVTERQAQDTTNSWLYVKAATETTDAAQQQNFYREAVNTSQTFYDSAKLATHLLNNNQTELSNEAMDKALKDFAARGYDPRLLRDEATMQRYGFPVAEFEEAIEQRDTAKGDVYAKWLSYFVSPDNTAVNTLLQRYANVLSQQGNREGADVVRSYTEGARLTRVDNILGTLANALGRAGWYGVLSLFVAIVGLWLTLLFKYWSPHSLLNKRRQAAKKSVNPFSRLLSIRYYSFTEKVFLVLLFASMLVLAALASWNERGRAVASEVAFSGGTFSSPVAQNALVNLPDNPSSNFIRGYAAQIAGNTEEATRFYQQAGNFAPALNNLAAITRDEATFRLAGNLPEAQANLGEEVTLSAWQTIAPKPLLVAPALSDLRAAAAGSWLDALRSVFVNPWTGLQNARPATIAPWLWTALQVLFLLLALIAVLWLFVPRPRLAANAPRNLLYHLFSLLIPGSGLADEMWGIVLIVPWAVVGLDVISDLLGWGLDIGINLRTGYIILGVIYLVNLVAFIIEYNSYLRRMKGLRQSNPDLAREYGMRVKTVGVN
jgi:outer membrane biosynthesis protein TonB